MRVDHENHIVTFRQSGLDTYGQCPERARFQWFTDLPDGNSDATVTGSALHKGVEFNLAHRKMDFDVISTGEMIEVAKVEYDRIEDEEGLTYVKGTKEDAMAFLETGIPAWRAFIEPYVAVDENLLLEYKFDIPLMQWGQWEIRLEGTIDCVDRYCIWDWKTTGSMFQFRQFERQRWAIQPTVYAAACMELGLLESPVLFRYGIIEKNKSKEKGAIVEVRRTHAHTDWLRRQVTGILVMWAAMGTEGPWPMFDHSALCSKLWCPAYSVCKGASIPEMDFAWKP